MQKRFGGLERKDKEVRKSVLLFFLLFSLSSWAKEHRVVILSTNDLHGALKGSPTMGGFAFIASAIQEIRRQEDVLLLDAGDCFQGELPVNKGEGLACVKFFNRLSYDATTIGNHEFDYLYCDNGDVLIYNDELCALKRALSFAAYPIVICNVKDMDGNSIPYTKEFVIVEKGGIRFGITGVLTPKTKTHYSPMGTKNLVFSDPVEALKKTGQNMKKAGADVIVVLAHLEGEVKGGNLTDELAKVAEAKVADIVVAGHAHSIIVWNEGQTKVMEASSEGKFLGFATVVIEKKKGKVVRKDIVVHSPLSICKKEEGAYCSSSYQGFQRITDPSPEILELVTEEYKTVEEMCRRVVVRAEESVTNEKGIESEMANLTADLMRESIKGASFAFINKGAVRGAIESGDVTYCDIAKVWPFEDSLMVFELSGDEIEALFEFAIKKVGKIFAISGLRIDGCRGVVFEDGSKPLKDKIYLGVTTAFLVTGGDRMDEFFSRLARRAKKADERPFRDVLVETLMAKGSIRKPEMNRVNLKCDEVKGEDYIF